MTLEQKKIRLAEKLGILSHDNHGPLYKTPQGYVRECPNWPEDLNAMRVVKLLLTDEQAAQYRDVLWTVIKQPAKVWKFHTPTAMEEFTAICQVLLEEEGE